MSRRGRPRAGEETARRQAVIAAALAELVDRGYENTTMLGIARRAGASKETLYSWFGSKEGLFAALIRHQAETTVARLDRALASREEPRQALTGFAVGFLELLLGEPSVSLNRAAMSSPDLAAVLLRHGRHTAGPIVEAYLERCADRGHMKIASPSAAFQLLYGLIIQDWQIRVLLGERAPDRDALLRHAQRAVDDFMLLVSHQRSAR